ncbi:MAG: GFA family protein [Gammaproteobacteria bacterium]
MSETTSRKGVCVCGEVTLNAAKASNSVSACHCNSCRRWSGGPFIDLNCGDEVSIEGAQSVSVFNSSDWAERGFCKHCGTHLFYRLKASNQYMIPVGLFTTDDNLQFSTQVFIDEKPDYYDFANKTENMTGAELFAKFGADS